MQDLGNIYLLCGIWVYVPVMLLQAKLSLCLFLIVLLHMAINIRQQDIDQFGVEMAMWRLV